jgi:hypothetical protein
MRALFFCMGIMIISGCTAQPPKPPLPDGASRVPINKAIPDKPESKVSHGTVIK